jgi:hypothetical protein
MKFYFHPDAEVEFDRAVGYYEQCQTGLGLEFAVVREHVRLKIAEDHGDMKSS